MALDDSYTNLILFLRWFHILAGITWLGHLYFFNYVNIPFQDALEKEALGKELKMKTNPILLPRALWWFRWGAMFTWILGCTLLVVKYQWGNLWIDQTTGQFSDRAMWICYGALLGTIMWFNVWFIIWPAQKKLISWTRDGQNPSEMAGLTKRVQRISRLNTYLSGPMLFGMIAPNNYGAINFKTVLVVTALGVSVIWFLIKLSPKVGTTV